MIELVCYLVAFVLFLLAAFSVTVQRVVLFPLGAAFAVLPSLIDAVQAVSGHAR